MLYKMSVNIFEIMNEVEKNMAVSALAQLLDQQPTAYAEVLAACRAMGWNASPTAQPADIIDELPSNVLPLIRRMLALLIYGDGSSDSPAVVPATDRLYAQLVPRVTSPNYPAEGFPSDGVRPFLPDAPSDRNFAHLPQALSALSARKISDLGDIPDGMTVLQLYTGRNSGITKIKDTYAWDLCYRDQLYQLFNALPSLEDIYIRCKRLTGYSYGYNVWFPSTITKCNGSSDVFEMPDLERFEGSAHVGFPTLAQNFKKWSFPKMVYTRCGFSYKDNQLDPRVIDWVEEVYMPKCKTFGEYASENILANFTNLKTVIMGNVTIWYSNKAFVNDVNLIHLEVGADGELLDHSANYAGWSPTNALDASGTDLIEEGSTAQNNLDQFLQNFRSHIALRLATQPVGNPSGKTLTLSQAVYDAIKDETHLFVFDEGTMTIYAYLTNIKHWTVTK